MTVQKNIAFRLLFRAGESIAIRSARLPGMARISLKMNSRCLTGTGAPKASEFVHNDCMRPTHPVLLLLGTCLLITGNAQQRDPRIGEWREDRTANSVGLYNVFEDLGNGMIRYHIAHNLAPQNRLYLDYRCDGNFYPVRNYQGVATDFSQTCTIVDANTVRMTAVRNKDGGFTGPKLDEQYWFDGEGTGTISRDGIHYRVVTQEKAADGRVIRSSERTFTRNAANCFSPDEKQFRECQQRTTPPRN
jgi:hypothetical protein